MAATTINGEARVQSALAPRRIGHVNLYVRDWLKSLDFYATVCGLEEVFRETPIKAGFLSSGNTHHDIGFLEAREGPRVGRDGFVQTKSGIGAKPEFNHFGIEMENERELVEGYRRLQKLGIAIEKLTDSAGLSKSVYLRDPDGLLLQFYADMTADWRAYYGGGERLVTGKWDPDDGVVPSRAALYTRDPVRYDAPRRAFRPMRVTGGTLYVKDLARSLAMGLNAIGHPKLAQMQRAILVLSPEHYAIFAAGGWDRKKIEAAILADTVRPGKDLVAGAQGVGEGLPAAFADKQVPKFYEDGLLIVRAGGPAGLFSAILPGWIAGRNRFELQPVTKEIKP